MPVLQGDKRQKILFSCIAALLALGLAEVALHIGYVLLRHRFVWQRSEEEFRVGNYVQRVDDERYITLRRGYSNPAFTDGSAPWKIEIDSHGFRKGANPPALNGPNIAVIGDSQPFGYRVNGENSYPSLLQEILRKRGDPRGVINAAIPSSSLDQAVHRYQYELARRYNIQVVVLQIYDPVTQFVLLGRDWTVQRNWVTYRNPPVTFLRFSALWHLYRQLAEAYELRVGGFVPGDQVAVRRWVSSLNRSLNLLMANTDSRVDRVILLPATAPPASWATMSDAHRTAMKILNATLRKFAEDHPNVEFMDTNALFASDVSGRMFIDDCCHLSRAGAEQVARLIADHLPPPPPKGAAE